METEEMDDLRLFDLLHRLKQMPLKEDALAAKENGAWRKYGTQEYIDIVTHLSYAFINLGVQPGDKIGLLSNNRPEWNFVDYACLQTGAINTPLYPTISEHDLKHVITEADIRYFFVSSPDFYHKVKACSEGANIKEVFCLGRTDELRTLHDLVELGKNNPQPQKLEALMAAIKPNDLATLILSLIHI